MIQPIIAFIGGGNMATSLIAGLIADGYDPQRLRVSEPDVAQHTYLKSRYAIHVTRNNVEAAAQGEIVVLAVKPQVIPSVAREVSAEVCKRMPLVVSIAAGIREPDIRRWLGCEAAVVRAMPNTPALVRSGVAALYANAFVRAEQKSQAESLLRAVGITLWIDDEQLMDAVTAVSGSGPGYLFFWMELMTTAGQRLGLPEETARLLTLQTAFGAAKMALESPEGPTTLRARVTSAGGTTERALQILREGGLERLFLEALQGAHDRSVELGRLFGGEQQ
jgi:pyrroline-5-carboxylate reductase